MRPVNLIPTDERRGAARSSSKGTGKSVYVALGVLGALVLAVFVYQLNANKVNDLQSQKDQLNAEITAANQQPAGGTDSKVSFAQAQDIAQARFDNVQATVDARFDFERRLRQLTHVLPRNVAIKTLLATVKPGADNINVDSAAGAAAPAPGGATGRARIDGPAFELEICGSISAETLATVMTRMRNLDGVSKVILGEEFSSTPSGGATATGGTNDVCLPSDVTWKIIVGFAPKPGAGSEAAPGGPAPRTATQQAQGASATSDSANASAGADTSGGGGSTP